MRVAAGSKHITINKAWKPQVVSDKSVVNKFQALSEKWDFLRATEKFFVGCSPGEGEKHMIQRSQNKKFIAYSLPSTSGNRQVIPILHIKPLRVFPVMVSDLGDGSHIKSMSALRQLVKEYAPQTIVYKSWIAHVFLEGYECLDMIKPPGSRSTNSEVYVLAKKSNTKSNLSTFVSQAKKILLTNPFCRANQFTNPLEMFGNGLLGIKVLEVCYEYDEQSKRLGGRDLQVFKQFQRQGIQMHPVFSRLTEQELYRLIKYQAGQIGGQSVWYDIIKDAFETYYKILERNVRVPAGIEKQQVAAFQKQAREEVKQRHEKSLAKVGFFVQGRVDEAPPMQEDLLVQLLSLEQNSQQWKTNHLRIPYNMDSIDCSVQYSLLEEFQKIEKRKQFLKLIDDRRECMDRIWRDKNEQNYLQMLAEGGEKVEVKNKVSVDKLSNNSLSSDQPLLINLSIDSDQRDVYQTIMINGEYHSMNYKVRIPKNSSKAIQDHIVSVKHDQMVSILRKQVEDQRQKESERQIEQLNRLQRQRCAQVQAKKGMKRTKTDEQPQRQPEQKQQEGEKIKLDELDQECSLQSSKTVLDQKVRGSDPGGDGSVSVIPERQGQDLHVELGSRHCADVEEEYLKKYDDNSDNDVQYSDDQYLDRDLYEQYENIQRDVNQEDDSEEDEEPQESYDDWYEQGNQKQQDYVPSTKGQWKEKVEIKVQDFCQPLIVQDVTQKVHVVQSEKQGQKVLCIQNVNLSEERREPIQAPDLPVDINDLKSDEIPKENSPKEVSSEAKEQKQENLRGFDKISKKNWSKMDHEQFSLLYGRLSQQRCMTMRKLYQSRKGKISQESRLKILCDPLMRELILQGCTPTQTISMIPDLLNRPEVVVRVVQGMSLQKAYKQQETQKEHDKSDWSDHSDDSQYQQSWQQWWKYFSSKDKNQQEWRKFYQRRSEEQKQYEEAYWEETTKSWKWEAYTLDQLKAFFGHTPTSIEQHLPSYGGWLTMILTTPYDSELLPVATYDYDGIRFQFSLEPPGWRCLSNVIISLSRTGHFSVFGKGYKIWEWGERPYCWQDVCVYVYNGQFCPDVVGPFTARFGQNYRNFVKAVKKVQQTWYISSDIRIQFIKSLRDNLGLKREVKPKPNNLQEAIQQLNMSAIDKYILEGRYFGKMVFLYNGSKKITNKNHKLYRNATIFSRKAYPGEGISISKLMKQQQVCLQPYDVKSDRLPIYFQMNFIRGRHQIIALQTSDTYYHYNENDFYQWKQVSRRNTAFASSQAEKWELIQGDQVLLHPEQDFQFFREGVRWFKQQELQKQFYQNRKRQLRGRQEGYEISQLKGFKTKKKQDLFQWIIPAKWRKEKNGACLIDAPNDWCVLFSIYALTYCHSIPWAVELFEFDESELYTEEAARYVWTCFSTRFADFKRRNYALLNISGYTEQDLLDGSLHEDVLYILLEKLKLEAYKTPPTVKSRSGIVLSSGHAMAYQADQQITMEAFWKVLAGEVSFPVELNTTRVRAEKRTRKGKNVSKKNKNNHVEHQGKEKRFKNRNLKQRMCIDWQKIRMEKLALLGQLRDLKRRLLDRLVREHETEHRYVLHQPSKFSSEYLKQIRECIRTILRDSPLEKLDAVQYDWQDAEPFVLKTQKEELSDIVLFSYLFRNGYYAENLLSKITVTNVESFKALSSVLKEEQFGWVPGKWFPIQDKKFIGSRRTATNQFVTRMDLEKFKGLDAPKFALKPFTYPPFNHTFLPTLFDISHTTPISRTKIQKKSTLNVSYGQVSVPLTGNFGKGANQFLCQNGWGVDFQSIRLAANQDHGHKFNRYCSTLVQGQNIARLFAGAKASENNIMIIEPGAKYLSRQKQMQKYFTLTWKIVLQLAKHLLGTAYLFVEQYVNFLQTQLDRLWLSPTTILQDFYLSYLNVSQVVPQLFESAPWTVIESIVLQNMPRKIIHYIPVRPLAIQCDDSYHRQSMESYKTGLNPKNNIWYHPIEVLPIQNLSFNRLGEVSYIEHDTHYYLSEWKPELHGTHYISGINFPDVPGYYPLALSEGKMLIESDCGNYTVRMNTNSSGQIYKHPATFVSGAERVLNLGAYQFFCTSVSSEKRHIQVLTGPHWNTQKSLFLTNIYNMVEKQTLAILPTINNLMAAWKPYILSSQHYVQLSQAIKMSKIMIRWHNKQGVGLLNKIKNKIFSDDIQVPFNDQGLRNMIQSVIRWCYIRCEDPKTLVISAQSYKWSLLGIGLFPRIQQYNTEKGYKVVERQWIIWKKKTIMQIPNFEETMQTRFLRGRKLASGCKDIKYKSQDRDDGSDDQDKYWFKDLQNAIVRHENSQAEKLQKSVTGKHNNDKRTFNVQKTSTRNELEQLLREVKVVSSIQQMITQAAIFQLKNKTERLLGGREVYKIKMDRGGDGGVLSSRICRLVDLKMLIQLELIRRAPKKQRQPYIKTDIRQNYYLSKPLSQQMLIPIHPSLRLKNVSTTYYNQLFIAMQTWVKKYGEEVVTCRNNKIKKYQADGKGVKTGYSIVKESSDIWQYEWGDSLNNRIHALQRLTCSQVDVDNEYVQWAQRHIDRAFAYIKGRLLQMESQARIIFASDNPIKKYTTKHSWDKSKKLLYIKGFLQQAKQQRKRIKSFMCFVKRGQVQVYDPIQGDQWINEKHELFGAKSRPRCICNTADRGMVQAWQSGVFRILKKIIPGFIQGTTKDQMTDIFKNMVKSCKCQCELQCQVRAISKDGSAFDGNQKLKVRNLIAKKFFTIFKPTLIRWWFEQMEIQLPNFFRGQVDDYVEDMYQSLVDFDNYLFMNIPGFNGPTWTDQMKRAASMWTQIEESCQSDWICLPIAGTTTSGDPAGTTLVNTLHSLMYDWLYAIQSGQTDPWQVDSRIQNVAAGDDTVIWAPQCRVQTIIDNIKKRTSPEKSLDILVGLGQVIDHSQIKIGNFWEIQFCSKVSFSSGQMEDWKTYRDPVKLLLTKQFYVKKHDKILNDPCLHPLALSIAYKAEKSSRLLEDILTLRAINLGAIEKGFIKKGNICVNIDMLDFLAEKLEHAYRTRDYGYQYQKEINQLAGVSIADLFMIQHQNCMIRGRRDSKIQIDVRGIKPIKLKYDKQPHKSEQIERKTCYHEIKNETLPPLAKQDPGIVSMIFKCQKISRVKRKMKPLINKHIHKIRFHGFHLFLFSSKTPRFVPIKRRVQLTFIRTSTAAASA